MHERLRYALDITGRLAAVASGDHYGSPGPNARRSKQELSDYVREILIPELQWFNRGPQKDPGDYYDQKSQEASLLRAWLRNERTPEGFKPGLKRQLELAEYVGD